MYTQRRVCISSFVCLTSSRTYIYCALHVYIHIILYTYKGVRACVSLSPWIIAVGRVAIGNYVVKKKIIIIKKITAIEFGARIL